MAGSRDLLPKPRSDLISAKRYNSTSRAGAAAGAVTSARQRVGSDSELLVEALPDLVLLIARDGTVLAQGGGRDTVGLKLPAAAAGKPLDACWPAAIAALLLQLTRKSIAQRATAEARFTNAGTEYVAQTSPRGPERAVCIVRPAANAILDDGSDSGSRPPPQFERRGFLQRFKDSIAGAALRENPIALAVIHVDGLADIAQLLASQVSEQVMSAALYRLPQSPQSAETQSAGPRWYLGQLAENLLAVVLESADREAIEECVARICSSLREPIRTGDAEFHLTPYAGAAILGQDASTPKILLEQARAAAMEARRAGVAPGIRFFTDTMELRALARIDLTRELRNAIANEDIRLRYIGRHDLESGRLAACVGYLRWQHPLRGEIRPAEFLRVAAATGLAASLSRAVLIHLRRDFAALAARCDPQVCISFGALRHHLLHEEFLSDVRQLVAEGGIPAERLELRIAEKVFITREPSHSEALKRLGVRLVVDEVARGSGSLDSLARAPIWGLQLDRGWVAALRTDPIARRVCRAGIEMAAALGLVPIATGVDDEQTREALLELGCAYGSGDLYRDEELDITPAI
ncbi:MAG TPA: EAL domain-containing protein [Steroidobacteraceae bacterium]|nr:EAL domain-containing protein [Steroidobacteraceae bacterium]